MLILTQILLAILVLILTIKLLRMLILSGQSPVTRPAPPAAAASRGSCSPPAQVTCLPLLRNIPGFHGHILQGVLVFSTFDGPIQQILQDSSCIKWQRQQFPLSCARESTWRWIVFSWLRFSLSEPWHRCMRQLQKGNACCSAKLMPPTAPLWTPALPAPASQPVFCARSLILQDQGRTRASVSVLAPSPSYVVAGSAPGSTQAMCNHAQASCNSERSLFAACSASCKP